MDASFADIDRLTDIHEACFARGWKASEFQSLLEDKMVTCLVLRRSTFRITDQVVGFVMVRCVLDEAEILTIAVDPDFQQAGCGHHLMADIDAQALWHRIAKLFLEVDASNKPALSLIEISGSSRSGNARAIMPAGRARPSLALIMQVCLSAKTPPNGPSGKE